MGRNILLKHRFARYPSADFLGIGRRAIGTGGLITVNERSATIAHSEVPDRALDKAHSGWASELPNRRAPQG